MLLTSKTLRPPRIRTRLLDNVSPRMCRRASLWFVLLLFGSTLSAPAQSVWTAPPRHATQLSVEWLKPVFEDGTDVSLLTSTLVVSAQAALSERLMLVGELPVSHVRLSAPSVRDDAPSSTSVGNPALGLKLRSTEGSFFMEMGARPPITEGPGVLSSAIGSLSDLNRFSAYTVNQVPVHLLGNYHYTPGSSPVTARLRAGPEIFLPAADNASATMILTYGVQGWYTEADGWLSAGVGLTGRWEVVQEARFRESSLHHLSATVQGTFGRVRPGLVVRLPLEADYREVFHAVIGLTMTVSLTEDPL